MSAAEVRITAAPTPEHAAPAPPPSRSLLRFLCTSNPFYALSAALFLAGLWISFGGQAQVVQTGALMSGLAGYTLLLAVTAYLLVRFGNVWDDARTVLLLVVLMFLATSVTFDEVLVDALPSWATSASSPGSPSPSPSARGSCAASAWRCRRTFASATTSSWHCSSSTRWPSARSSPSRAARS